MNSSMVRRNGSGPMQRQQPAGRAANGATGGTVRTIEDLLKKHGSEIALVLPEHVTPERLLRIALSEVRRNPRLAQCSAPSLLGAIFTCAQLGLEPGGPLGHAFLIPYRDECQFQIGYKGMIELARRSGQIESLSARSVYENDRFDYSYGLHEDLVHQPATGERGELTHAYAVAKLKDGGIQFEVMDRHELEEIRDGSQGYQTAIKYNKKDSPWISSFDEMCRKTVIRRMFKYLPVSIELVKAASLDERADRGQRQETDLDHLLLPAEVPAETPAIAAAAAPVATLTEQQQQQLLTALERQLSPIGRAAFQADACNAFGIEALAEIPAEQHTALMQSLANAGSRERWNRGCGHADGEPVLSAEQIAELTPQATEATEEAPPQQPAAAAPQRVAKPALRAAAAAAPEPDPAPAESEQEEPGEDSIQRELV
jgi:recombination protein RecT